MQSLPRELEEAAYIDGSTTLGVYSRVFLPLLTPVTATCAIRCGVGRARVSQKLQDPSGLKFHVGFPPLLLLCRPTMGISVQTGKHSRRQK